MWYDMIWYLCPAEQKSRYETYINLLQAKLRAETDDLEKIEASVMGGLDEGRGGREGFLRKTQSSPSISQAHGLNGRAAGRTAPGQRSWGETPCPWNKRPLPPPPVALPSSEFPVFNCTEKLL